MDDGQIGLYVTRLPEELLAESENADCFAIRVVKRNSGFLAAIPTGYIREEVINAGNSDAAVAMMEPSLLITPSGGGGGRGTDQR